MYETKTSEPFFSQSQRIPSQLEDDEISPNWSDYNTAINGGAQAVFAKDINNSHAKVFTGDLSHDDMLKYQLTLPKVERNFYKILIDDKPLKLSTTLTFLQL